MGMFDPSYVTEVYSDIMSRRGTGWVNISKSEIPEGLLPKNAVRQQSTDLAYAGRDARTEAG